MSIKNDIKKAVLHQRWIDEDGDVCVLDNAFGNVFERCVVNPYEQRIAETGETNVVAWAAGILIIFGAIFRIYQTAYGKN